MVATVVAAEPTAVFYRYKTPRGCAAWHAVCMTKQNKLCLLCARTLQSVQKRHGERGRRDSRNRVTQRALLSRGTRPATKLCVHESLNLNRCEGLALRWSSIRDRGEIKATPKASIHAYVLVARTSSFTRVDDRRVRLCQCPTEKKTRHLDSSAAKLVSPKKNKKQREKGCPAKNGKYRM